MSCSICTHQDRAGGAVTLHVGVLKRKCFFFFFSSAVELEGDAKTGLIMCVWGQGQLFFKRD